MSAAAWIVALLSAYPHLQHRACIEARAPQIAADADSAAARHGVPVALLLAVAVLELHLGCAPRSGCDAAIRTRALCRTSGGACALAARTSATAPTTCGALQRA